MLKSNFKNAVSIHSAHDIDWGNQQSEACEPANRQLAQCRANIQQLGAEEICTGTISVVRLFEGEEVGGRVEATSLFGRGPRRGRLGC